MPNSFRAWWAIRSFLGMVCWSLAISGIVTAAEVGRFTQVTGQVFLLKQGKTPGQAVKEHAGVEPSDIVETETNGKATIKFLDDSIMVVSPGSRLKIEEFDVNMEKGVRRAAFFFFQGVMRFTVSRLFNLKEPDFVVKTEDAILGVRGTDAVVVKINLPNHQALYLYTLQGVIMMATSMENMRLAQGVIVRTLQANQIFRGQPLSPVPLSITPSELKILGGLIAQGLPPAAPVPVVINAIRLLQRFSDLPGEPLTPAPPARLSVPGMPAGESTGEVAPPVPPLQVDSTSQTTLGTGVTSASQ